LTENPFRDSAPARSLEHGVRVAAACNGVLLVWLYAVAAPTTDIRARIPFLLQIFDLITWLQLGGIATVGGLVGLAITGGWSRKAVAGVVVGAFLSLMLLGSGLVGDLIPAGHESPPKYWLLAAAIAAAGLALAHARHQVKSANDQSRGRAA
jgi:peptidoglycan/LPS O-acetylase OafA/YrhL